MSDTDDLIESAWGIIANASSGNWECESRDWQEAAAAWRERYHAWLSERVPAPAPAAGLSEEITRVQNDDDDTHTSEVD